MSASGLRPTVITSLLKVKALSGRPFKDSRILSNRLPDMVHLARPRDSRRSHGKAQAGINRLRYRPGRRGELERSPSTTSGIRGIEPVEPEPGRPALQPRPLLAENVVKPRVRYARWKGC